MNSKKKLEILQYMSCALRSLALPFYPFLARFFLPAHSSPPEVQEEEEGGARGARGAGGAEEGRGVRGAEEEEEGGQGGQGAQGAQGAQEEVPTICHIENSPHVIPCAGRKLEWSTLGSRITWKIVLFSRTVRV